MKYFQIKQKAFILLFIVLSMPFMLSCNHNATKQTSQAEMKTEEKPLNKGTLPDETKGVSAISTDIDITKDQPPQISVEIDNSASSSKVDIGAANSTSKIIHKEASDSNSNVEKQPSKGSTNVSNNVATPLPPISLDKNAKLNFIEIAKLSQKDKPFIKIGSSENDILNTMGPPHKSEYDGTTQSYIYSYPITNVSRSSATLYLKRIDNQFIVVGWYNSDNILKVSTEPQSPSAPKFTLGYTMDEVSRSSGTPMYYEATDFQSYDRTTYWSYSDGSRVDFDRTDKVVAWSNRGSLQVSVGNKLNNAPSIKLGSIFQDVISSLGTPNQLSCSSMDYTPTFLKYGESTINLYNGRVNGWSNTGNLNINIGNKHPSAPEVLIGSTVNDVIYSLGTPDSITATNYIPKTLVYGKREFMIDNKTQKVTAINTIN